MPARVAAPLREYRCAAGVRQSQGFQATEHDRGQALAHGPAQQRCLRADAVAVGLGHQLAVLHDDQRAGVPPGGVVPREHPLDPLLQVRVDGRHGAARRPLGIARRDGCCGDAVQFTGIADIQGAAEAGAEGGFRGPHTQQLGGYRVVAVLQVEQAIGRRIGSQVVANALVVEARHKAAGAGQLGAHAGGHAHRVAKFGHGKTQQPGGEQRQRQQQRDRAAQ